MNSGKKNAKEKSDFGYTNQGLFREKVEAYLISGEQFTLVGHLQHHGEDAFMRLIKVYFIAANRAFT